MLLTIIRKLVHHLRRKVAQKQVLGNSCDNNLLYLHSKIKPASDHKKENKIFRSPSQQLSNFHLMSKSSRVRSWRSLQNQLNNFATKELFPRVLSTFYQLSHYQHFLTTSGHLHFMLKYIRQEIKTYITMTGNNWWRPNKTTIASLDILCLPHTVGMFNCIPKHLTPQERKIYIRVFQRHPHYA